MFRVVKMDSEIKKEEKSTASPKHKGFGRISVLDDIIIYMLITYAAAVSFYEGNVPEKMAGAYRGIIFAVFAAVTLYFNFRNGALKKYGYAVFSVLFWMIPQALIVLADNGPESMRYSLTMYLISEFLTIYIKTPAAAVGNIFGTGSGIGLVIIILISAFTFLLGVVLSDSKVKKIFNGNYTERC